jgi:hypothetical protein
MLMSLFLAAVVVADEAVPRVVVTAERDAEWASYRYAYKAAAYVGAVIRNRPLIQAHMQIRPKDPARSLEGLQLRLVGEHTDMAIEVDPLGRATLPMIKQAYQDDAVLRLNRHKDDYYFSGRYSIRDHADGAYDAAELRNACEQLIGAQRESGYRVRLIGKKCAGIKFVYASAGCGANALVAE